VNIKSGNPIQVNLTYDGTTLTETLLDTVTSDMFTTTYTFEGSTATPPAFTGKLEGDIGFDRGYVGFTAATGGAQATQTVSNFTYKEMPEPGSLGLAGVGIVSVLLYCWRNRNRARS
jgi:hypothetical protein